MTKVLVANLASPANPGDQAIFRGTLKLLRQYFQDHETTVVTRAYSERRVYEDLGCRVVRNYPDVQQIATDSKLRKMLNIPKALLNPDDIQQAVRETDCVFLVGGAYFYSYRPMMPGLTYLSHLTAVAWAKHYKKPVIFLPQSYGPFASQLSRKLFDWAMRQAELVFYREKISGDWLEKTYPAYRNKFNFMPDLALYLDRRDLITDSSVGDHSGIIGVTVRAWKKDQQDQDVYMNVLTDALTGLHKNLKARIRIIAQVQDPKKGEGDEWISRVLADRVIREIGSEKVELCVAKPYFQLADICRLYNGCRFLIGMRLHSGLLSFLVGQPALIVGYQHKAEGVLRSLGLEELYVGSFEQVSQERLKALCENMWYGESDWKKKIETSLVNVRHEIWSTFKENMDALSL